MDGDRTNSRSLVVVLASLRKYEVQAGYAAGLAILSVIPLVATIFLMLRNYHSDVRQIVYQSNNYAFAVLGCIGLSVLSGFLGCLLGYNSAGERRNDRPKRSWIGFLLGGFVITLNVIALVAFVMLRFNHPGT